jgi:glutamate carboxypeptidase
MTTQPTATPIEPGRGVDDDELRAIEAAVRADEDAFLADFERLVNIDCGSYTPAGVDEAGRWTGSFFEQLGARVEHRPDPNGRLGATVIATFEGSPSAGPRVLVIGHLDTVFDPGTVAERPFRIEDGRARGPGVSDMKGGLLTGLYAVKTLVERGTMPFERLVFIANPDEEIGSPASTPHIRELAADSDVAFVLEAARASGAIVSARKGTIDLHLTVHGRAAHAGVEPEKGRSAILEAARLVRDLHALNGRWPGVTVNVGEIEGGTRPNVVPERCRLKVDIRAVTAVDQDAVTAEIERLATATEVPDTSVEIRKVSGHRPMEKLQRSGRLADHATALGRRLGFEAPDVATGGASDANTTSGMGVPSLDGLGPVGGDDHAPAEWVDIASIVPRTAMFAALLLAVARDPVVAGWRDPA